MFDSRSTIVKVGGYVIIGFFTLIIIISFGVPDYMSSLGDTENIVANINGESIHILDYLRFRDNTARRYKGMPDKQKRRRVLYDLIRYRLKIQQAQKLGISVTDDKVKQFIRNLPMFKDESGKFSNENFKIFLNRYRMGLLEYYTMVKEVLIDEQMNNMLTMGISVSPDEVKDENILKNSKIQIRYCVVPTKIIKNRLKNEISVTDKEIDEEMKKNPDEVKDPKTDRKRIRRKLENQKLEKKKRELSFAIDKLAREEKPFAMAAALLGGPVKLSKEFKIGEPISEMGSKGKPLYSLGNSKIFRDDCLSIGIGKTSRAISTFEGIYIFTPVKKTMKTGEPSPDIYSSIEGKLTEEKYTSLYISMMMKFREKSKIIEKMKFDEKK